MWFIVVLFVNFFDFATSLFSRGLLLLSEQDGVVKFMKWTTMQILNVPVSFALKNLQLHQRFIEDIYLYIQKCRLRYSGMCEI